MTIPLDQLTANLPTAPRVTAEEVAETACPVLVVLDDDPTGTQSVHDLPVITGWTVDDLAWALGTGARAVYVMTNSRSLAPGDAKRVNEEVVRNGLEAARRTGAEVAFVSRSDSTLRGHFPLEPDTICDLLAAEGFDVDGILVVPAFPDAGRITIDSVHYAGNPATGYVPVGQTEFAADASFGYRSSNLAEWVEEKSSGRWKADDVLPITLGTLRGPREDLVAALSSAHDRQPIVVDCLEENDLRLLALGLAGAEANGRRYVHRVGPPFVRARIGQEARAPLTAAECAPRAGATEDTTGARGGLVAVGSHVGLTKRQVQTLKDELGTPELLLDVPTILEPTTRAAEIARVAAEAAQRLLEGTVIVRAGGELVVGVDADDSLRIARSVSDALVETVRTILATRPPRFVIAKGGITSSDVASKGLQIRHALVRGPMLPGIVSMWEPVDGPARGIPYIVFAGNVGDETSLATVVATLQG